MLENLPSVACSAAFDMIDAALHIRYKRLLRDSHDDVCLPTGKLCSSILDYLESNCKDRTCCDAQVQQTLVSIAKYLLRSAMTLLACPQTSSVFLLIRSCRAGAYCVMNLHHD